MPKIPECGKITQSEKMLRKPRVRNARREETVMKFVCEGLVLSDAAITVSKACAARTTMPVLECIRMTAENDGVTLVAYDGELSIRKKVKADVLEEGEICVNGRFFSDFIVKVSDMTVSVGTCEKGLEISYGDSRSFLQTLPASDFPKLKSEDGSDYFQVKQSAFKELIGRTVFCCATDESRPILKGCLLEAGEGKLRATALDGYRMATAECEAEGSGSLKLVCPARTLTEISRMLDDGEESLRVGVSKNMLSVTVDDTAVESRLYTGEFVNAEKIYPHEFATAVKVSKAELSESVERAIVLIRGDKNNLVLFEIKGDGILITANSEIGNVSETVKAELTGRELKIAMNGKYLLDALKVLDEETIVLSFNTPVSPFTLENETDKGNSCLILPVRTSA